MTAGFLKRIYSGRRGFILLESGISLQGFRLTRLVPFRRTLDGGGV